MTFQVIELTDAVLKRYIGGHLHVLDSNKDTARGGRIAEVSLTLGAHQPSVLQATIDGGYASVGGGYENAGRSQFTFYLRTFQVHQYPDGVLRLEMPRVPGVLVVLLPESSPVVNR